MADTRSASSCAATISEVCANWSISTQSSATMSSLASPSAISYEAARACLACPRPRRCCAARSWMHASSGCEAQPRRVESGRRSHRSVGRVQVRIDKRRACEDHSCAFSPSCSFWTLPRDLSLSAPGVVRRLFTAVRDSSRLPARHACVLARSLSAEHGVGCCSSTVSARWQSTSGARRRPACAHA